jgi:hypothetical protein
MDYGGCSSKGAPKQRTSEGKPPKEKERLACLSFAADYLGVAESGDHRYSSEDVA